MLSSLGEAIAVSKAVTIIIQIILQGVAIHREHVAGLHESPSLSILPTAFVCVAPPVVLRSVIFLVLIY